MKRYNMGIYGSDPTEHETGDWLRWEDVKEFIHENTRYKLANDYCEGKIQEPEEKLRTGIPILEEAAARIDYEGISEKLADENVRLREALEYYACKENYYIPCDGSTGGLTVIDADEGSIAKAALEEKP